LVLPEPLQPRHAGALARFLPWTDRAGEWWRGWPRLSLGAPFVIFYLAVSWALFLPIAHFAEGRLQIDQDSLRPFLYHIPDLVENPTRLLPAIPSALFLNHDSTQLLLVTILLVSFGAAVEVHEGTRRTVLIFFGSAVTAALVASFLLLVIYPTFLSHPALEEATVRTWSGGSVGCFGLMGAFAARAQRPWLLLGLYLLWEGLVSWLHLRSYVPVFHLSALFIGFLVVRRALGPMLPPSSADAVPVSR
jgi:hypothetical protein